MVKLFGGSGRNGNFPVSMAYIQIPLKYTAIVFYKYAYSRSLGLDVQRGMLKQIFSVKYIFEMKLSLINFCPYWKRFRRADIIVEQY